MSPVAVSIEHHRQNHNGSDELNCQFANVHDVKAYCIDAQRKDGISHEVGREVCSFDTLSNANRSEKCRNREGFDLPAVSANARAS